MVVNRLLEIHNSFVNISKKMDFLPLFLLRLYLSPVFIQAGWTKLQNFESTVTWFGNTDWGLGLPLPALFVSLTILVELVGGIFILLGLFTRAMSVPLAITMLVAGVSVHLENGWLAISDASSWLADGTILYNERVMDAVAKKEKAIEILQTHGHYDWLTSSGPITILNNGVEFAFTYLLMTLVLLVYGGGRFLSADYYLSKNN